MNRRELIAAAATACVCALCPSALALAAAGPSGPVEVGPVKDFAKEGAYDAWVAKGFFIVRQKDRLYATSSVCTHQNTTKMAVKGDLFACPRHGSQFKFTGELAKGPAKQPLARFGISVNAAGKVVVDTSKRFPQDKWQEQGSFLKVS
jgi:nitrite reductase/ring-hydroxylating ferredoxin subunit